MIVLLHGDLMSFTDGKLSSFKSGLEGVGFG